MKKTLSMHPLVKGISPSQWARLSDGRRVYENRKAIRESYETRARITMHQYVGFEGKHCSRMDSDDLQRTKEECSWVWGVREKQWMQKPEVQS